jgi:hypothetical protein
MAIAIGAQAQFARVSAISLRPFPYTDAVSGTLSPPFIINLRLQAV